MPTLHKLPSPSHAWRGRMPQAQVTIDDGALVVMDHEHFQQHQAVMHQVHYSTDVVANSAYMDILVSVGSKLTHLSAAVLCEGYSKVFFYEGVTVSGGTVITPYVRNREAALAGTAPSISTVYKHTPTTITDLGTSIFPNGVHVPGGSSPARPSAGGRASDEWALAPSTDYLIRVQNLSGGDIYMDFEADIYEDEHPYPGG